MVNRDFFDSLSIKELKYLKSFLDSDLGVEKLKNNLNISLRRKNDKRRADNFLVMIDDLNISLDSINILKQNGIFTVGQLVETEIDDIEGLGFITREEVIWAREFFDFSKPVISDEKPYIKH